MEMTDARALNRVIVSLYREGREVPLGNFQAWALEQIKGLIAFDSAWWGNATASPPALHGMDYLHNCEQSIVALYPTFLRQDLFAAALIARTGSAINLSDLTTRGRYVRTPLYREFARDYKIEWALGTVLIEPVSSLYEFLILWRHDSRRPFVESERQTKELLMPHLMETLRSARLHHFRKVSNYDNHPWAMIDSGGFLREVSPAFIACLQEHWPGWTGNRLPAPLAAKVEAGLACTLAAGDCEVTSCASLRYLRVRAHGALDRLSAREREIAVRYARGETYSTIAAKLSLSPATVRSHLAHCFRKLLVNNKAELARRLKE